MSFITNAPRLALMAAMDLPAGADVPDWVHLLPAGASILTYDGRGPYRMTDPAALIAASMADLRGMLIDENHATDKPVISAEAHGWIKALEARTDGIWARVDWNPSGKAMLANRSYRGISPVIEHLDDGSILRIKRASLTNVPNLKYLTALNMETPMEGLSRIAEALGLGPDATMEQILAAVGKMKDANKPAADAPVAALQSALTEIGTVLGVDGGNTTVVIAAVHALQSAHGTVAAQATRIAALERGAADAWMAGLIAAKVGVPADKREGLIVLHMQDAVQAAGIAKMYPSGADIIFAAAPPAADGAPLTALNAEQRFAAENLGLSTVAYLKALNDERAQQKDR